MSNFFETLDKTNVLPDSRLTKIVTPKGAFQGELGWMEPTFCASCHLRGPDTPSENMTFLFWLCNECFPKYGHIAGTMVMPDQVFWEKIRQEQLEKYGRVLTPAELESVVAADASPLATLIKEGR